MDTKLWVGLWTPKTTHDFMPLNPFSPSPLLFTRTHILHTHRIGSSSLLQQPSWPLGTSYEIEHSPPPKFWKDFLSHHPSSFGLTPLSPPESAIVGDQGPDEVDLT